MENTLDTLSPEYFTDDHILMSSVNAMAVSILKWNRKLSLMTNILDWNGFMECVAKVKSK